MTEQRSIGARTEGTGRFPVHGSLRRVEGGKRWEELVARGEAPAKENETGTGYLKGRNSSAERVD